MLKKCLAVLFMVAIAGLLTANFAIAAPLSLTENEEALLADEPPLTQAEIDAFIAIYPELLAAGESADEDAVPQTAQKAGWNKIRTAYIGSKIGLGYSLLLDPENTQALVETGLIPQSYLPTTTEQALIEKNFEALDAMFNSVQ